MDHLWGNHYFSPSFSFCVSPRKKKLRRFYPHQGGRHSLHKAEIGRGPLPSLVILKLILKTEDLVGVCNLKHRCRHMPEWYVCADGQHVTSQEGPSPVYSLLSEAWPSWAARWNPDIETQGAGHALLGLFIHRLVLSVYTHFSRTEVTHNAALCIAFSLA